MSINSIVGISPQNLETINNVKKEQAELDSFKDTFDSAIKTKDDEELKQACVEFESYFLNMMFKSMRSTVTLNEKSNAEKIFQESLDQQLTQKMANEGGIGLADMMYKQLDRQKNAINLQA